MIETREGPDTGVTDLTAYVRGAMSAGRKVHLCIDGQSSLMVEDATSLQMLLDLVDRLETIESLRESIASLDEGLGRPVAEAFAELRHKLGLPPAP